jgi:hypothetical protein
VPQLGLRGDALVAELAGALDEERGEVVAALALHAREFCFPLSVR